jgi:hypothetical protein
VDIVFVENEEVLLHLYSCMKMNTCVKMKKLPALGEDLEMFFA